MQDKKRFLSKKLLKIWGQMYIPKFTDLSVEYSFSFKGISWWSSNPSFKASQCSCEEEEEDVRFDFVLFYQFWGLKDKSFHAKKVALFGSNTKCNLLLSAPGYRPTQIYAHQKRPFSGYKPWAYTSDFMVYLIINFILKYIPFIHITSFVYLCMVMIN